MVGLVPAGVFLGERREHLPTPWQRLPKCMLDGDRSASARDLAIKLVVSGYLEVTNLTSNRGQVDATDGFSTIWDRHLQTGGSVLVYPMTTLMA